MPRKTKTPAVVEKAVSEEEVASEEEVSEEEAPRSSEKRDKKQVTIEEESEEEEAPEPKKGAGKKGAGKKTAAKKIAVTKSTGEKPVRKSRTITREDIISKFEEMESVIETEIERLRDNTTKTKGTGIQFLRGLKKRTKDLKNCTTRVMKQKQKTPRKNNNSGFLKPVMISKEMSGFTGWDRETPTSRVDVTRFMCKYIKDNDLQNPKDRRVITPDKNMTKLLKYDSKNDPPLTYYRMQTYMKPHFERIETPAAVAS